MMSDDKFDIYCVNGGVGGQYDFDCEIVNYYKIISNLQKLKSMRDIVIQDMTEDKCDFVPRIRFLINDWKGQYPNFRKMLRPKEMDWLLTKCARNEDVINFVIKSGYKDEPELDEEGKPLLNRTTPVHYAANYMTNNSRVRKLFEIYDRFDVNYTDVDGLTHLEKFLELGQNPNILPPKSVESQKGEDEEEEGEEANEDENEDEEEEGEEANEDDNEDEEDKDEEDDELVRPPLHMAVELNHRKIVELLLKNGADPNLATAEGLTPLHVIVREGYYDSGLADFFFKICDDEHLMVLVNTQDARGDTPLHWALEDGYDYLTELLLRRGADSSLVNEEGLTPLHTLCKVNYDAHETAGIFFKVNDEIQQTVPIDARDKKGNTPLHLALSRGHKAMIELLLRRDANPNLVNEEGSTPLHVICQRKFDDGLMKLFFDEVQTTVQVDALDKSGHSPLQWAVANFLLDTIDVLLDHGADLWSFVFPIVGHFDEDLKLRHNPISFKLKFASDAMAVVEHLEKRDGYKLDRSDAITIMNAFDKYDFFKRPANLDKSWYNDEKFVKKAKEMMVKPSLSIYDMILMGPEASEKLISYTEMYDFVRSSEYFEFSKTYRDACDTYFCEILTRRFFKRWAVICFSELIKDKFSILCCDIIIDYLKNEDLRRICLAAEAEN